MRSNYRKKIKDTDRKKMKLMNMGLSLHVAGFVVCCGMMLHCAADSKVHYHEFHVSSNN